MKKGIISLFIIGLFFFGCAGVEDQQPNKEEPEVDVTDPSTEEKKEETLEDWANSIPQKSSYQNPVTDVGLPDPTLIRGEDGLFYLFATEDTWHNIPIMVSPNLIDWRYIGTVFSAARRPKYIENGELWAPDVNKVGDKYLLYYSFARAWGTWDCAVGVATADSLRAKWQDYGKIFTSSDIGVIGSIDPCFYSEGGKNWLIWGSYTGIWIIELSEDGLSVKPGAEKLCVAHRYAIEGAILHKKDNKYYLIVSEGGTAYGQHYRLGVFCSDNLLGPYFNKQGLAAAEDAEPEYFLSENENFICPGHCSKIITDDAGKDWLLYHAFLKDIDYARYLMLDNVIWEDGWPRIGDGHPTKESSIAPYFNR